MTSHTRNPSSDTYNEESPPSSETTSAAVSRTGSFSGTSMRDEDWEGMAQLDRLTMFDLLDGIALPSLALNHRIEKWNRSLQKQSEALKKQSQKVKETYQTQKEKMLKKKDTEVERFQRRYRDGVDKLAARWQDQKVVTAREKIAFVLGVSNIFISGLLVGGHSEYIHYWYTLQMMIFMPLRYYTYHARGYHYFLADLCYFTNLLLLLSIWVFPQSRRLFISTYCLAYGNNAWAIAMWRNSLVFHSLDKVTSLFIHLMPPVVMHCLVHQRSMAGRLTAVDRLHQEGPFTLVEMITWASVPYMIWQAAYHIFITVRRKDKIAAGRPTSFTWLRKSYSKTLLGKMVLKLPSSLQEVAFMGIQYAYAVLTMLPAPLWYRSRYASAAFLSIVGLWSVYNGATYYIDVFGKRFERELEQLRADVQRWQSSPGSYPMTPGVGTPIPQSAHQSQPSLSLSDGGDGSRNGNGETSYFNLNGSTTSASGNDYDGLVMKGGERGRNGSGSGSGSEVDGQGGEELDGLRERSGTFTSVSSMGMS